MVRMVSLYALVCAGFFTVCFEDMAAVRQNKLPAIPLLHQAALQGNVEAFYGYFLQGANLDQVDDCGRTAAHAAAENGCLKIIKLLACKGANFNIKNKFGKTPLDVALLNEHHKIVNFLKMSSLQKSSKMDIDEPDVKFLANSIAALHLSKK
ncbi:MAG: hypothetical protein UW09_C0001G0010 [candidate division TM6 bacterium GW2011_GWF2_43_87]|nr:MAG: hypothetical protein UW09_C0001G0010 [candidate division TM6 bacterium GW2011_GWF2_43_87]